MAFWTDTGKNAITPKRKDLFMVEMDLFNDGATRNVWFAKSIDKPKVNFKKDTRAIDGMQGSNDSMDAQSMGGVDIFEPLTLKITDL